ncbi:MAG: type 1 periplasmic binding fold superfamily protein [Flavobacteriales bacterium]
MYKPTTPLTLALGLTLFFAACKKDEKVDPITPPAPVNEEELITDVRILFTDPSNNTYEWHAEFNDAGTLIQGDTLPANTTLQADIIVLDASTTPPDTVSNEILAEGDEHQFFFRATGVDITFAYSDTDANGRPIGLVSAWQTGSAGVGEVEVILRHEPVKDASGVSTGDITNAGGSTDIEVTFPAVLQ